MAKGRGRLSYYDCKPFPARLKRAFTVPYSELAMHARIAGKRAKLVCIRSPGDVCVQPLGKGGVTSWPDRPAGVGKAPVCGLPGEVLPFDLRRKIAAVGIDLRGGPVKTRRRARRR